MPGVTKVCTRVSLTHCYGGNHTYALQAVADVDEFRALAAQIGGRQQKLQRTVATVAVQVSKKQGEQLVGVHPSRFQSGEWSSNALAKHRCHISYLSSLSDSSYNRGRILPRQDQLTKRNPKYHLAG